MEVFVMTVPRTAEDERDSALGGFTRRTGQLFRQTDIGSKSGGRGRKIPFDELMTLLQLLNDGQLRVEDLVSPAEMTYRMFISPSAQLKLVQERNERLGWGFTEADFEALGQPPAWFTDPPLVAVVLDVSLDDPIQTFVMATDCSREIHSGEMSIFLNRSDDWYAWLRLIEGKEHKRGLCWRVVDLGANWNKDGQSLSPFEYQNPETSPGAVIPWAASYFPQWLLAIGYGYVPNVWITGYQVNTSVWHGGEEAWSAVPDLCKCRPSGEAIGFYHGSSDLTSPLYQGGKWAIPELVPAV